MQNVLDIDECSERSHGCAHLCVNTYGSYRCTCYVGYELNPNNRDCRGKLKLFFFLRPQEAQALKCLTGNMSDYLGEYALENEYYAAIKRYGYYVSKGCLSVDN